MKGLPGEGLAEIQHGGVESRSGYPVAAVRFPVQRISLKRAADALHMHPDLMGTARFQPQLYKGCIFRLPFFYSLVTGLRVLSLRIP